MHELAICQALVDKVQSVAEEQHACRVTSIVIGMGPLAGVEEQLLVNAYPVASISTIAEHAELLIEHLPVRIKCNCCNKESRARPNRMVCRHCGNWQTTLVSGDELLLLSVELEKAPATYSANDEKPVVN